LPDPPPPDVSFRLAGLLSSHVGDRKRLIRLQNCLESVAEQTEKLDAFFVVWSAPDTLAPEVESMLNDLGKKLAPSPLHWLRQTNRTSQFYDLRWIYNELVSREPKGTWLIFSDDDDLWGPERVRLYLEVINENCRQPGVTGVCATHKVRPTSRSKVAQKVAEVFQHLESGSAAHCGGVHVEEEFFDFAVPAESLGNFFNTCNDETLLHPFCDLRFSRFIQEYYENGRVMYFPTDKTNPWVYYYSTAYRATEDDEAYEQYVEQDQASTVVKVRAEDRREAEDLCWQMSAGRRPEEEELDEMTGFVSGLRQNIESVLIRHFPEVPMKTGEMKRVAVGQAQGQGGGDGGGHPRGVWKHPCAIAGHPRALAGHPRGVWGHPLTLAGYPRAVAGQPRAVAGHPRAGRREEGKSGGERWREHIAGQLSSSRSLGASSRGCGSSSRVSGSSSRSLGASSRGCGSSSRSLGSSSRGPAGGRKEGEAVAHRGTVIILALLRVILARWRVVLAAFGGILAWLRAVLAELGVILVRACGRSSSRRLGASSRGCGSSSRSLGSSSRWPAGGRKWGEAGAHRGTVIILAASGGILARLQIILAFLWVILAAFGGILARLRVILAELGVILAWAGGRRERGGGGSASKDSYHPRPRVVLGIPARLQASSRSFWHPRAGLGGEGKGRRRGILSHFGIYTSRGASSRGASSRGSSSRGSALRGSFLARIILARITLARIVLARVILSRVILALVILAWGILARAILVRVILALVILARVIFARVIIARIILARALAAGRDFKKGELKLVALTEEELLQAAEAEEDPLDFLQKLLQDTPGKAALFLGVVFAAKTVAWAGTVIIVSQCRGIYASRLWGANSPAAMAASAWRQHCPFMARRLDAAAARAAASRSSAALARLLGIPAADLAPAAAEGTIAFRFLWPLWFPVQCWAMIRWWPWPHPEDRGSLPRAEHAVADLTDARAEDIE
ncbi:unnamed protein product, partial [Polarella glacialis]